MSISYTSKNIKFQSKSHDRTNQVHVFSSWKKILKKKKRFEDTAEKQRKTIEDVAKKQIKTLQTWNTDQQLKSISDLFSKDFINPDKLEKIKKRWISKKQKEITRNQ